MKVTILVDNQAEDGLVGEHGFAMWIEADDWRILFDTGQGAAFCHNVRELGIDLAGTEALVLSHGHYDHTGNVAQVLEAAPETRVFCHPAAVQPRYSIRDGIAKPIQMPRAAEAALGRVQEHKLLWVSRPMLISCRLGVTGPIPRLNNFEDPGGPFFLDAEGQRPDPIEDDQALWIRTEKGIIVCAGCCHAGLLNTLNYIQRLNHGQKIRAVIGGLHLVNADQERLDQTIAGLRLFEPELLVPCHCTGEAAVAILRDALGDSVKPGAAGMSFDF